MKPQYFNNELIFKCGVFPLLSLSLLPPPSLSLTHNPYQVNIKSCHNFNFDARNNSELF